MVPPHVNISGPKGAATEYNVTGLRANTNYTVYVRAVSLGLIGREVSTVAKTIRGSKYKKIRSCINNHYNHYVYFLHIHIIYITIV